MKLVFGSAWTTVGDQKCRQVLETPKQGRVSSFMSYYFCGISLWQGLTDTGISKGEASPEGPSYQHLWDSAKSPVHFWMAGAFQKGHLAKMCTNSRARAPSVSQCSDHGSSSIDHKGQFAVGVLIKRHLHWQEVLNYSRTTKTKTVISDLPHSSWLLMSYTLFWREALSWGGHSLRAHFCGLTVMKYIYEIQTADSKSTSNLGQDKLYLSGPAALGDRSGECDHLGSSGIPQFQWGFISF